MTIVMVAMLLLVFMGMAAFAVDFARMYWMRTQLQTVADASAMAAAMQIARGQKLTATDTALAYAARNPVENALATVTAANVEPGNFTDAGGFQLRAWADADVNAVRVTPSYVANYTFGRIFQPTATLSATATAAVGSPTSSDCLKPWAVSYETLINALNTLDGGARTINDDLTDADVDMLENNGSVIPLLLNTGNFTSPGNIAQVVVMDPCGGNNCYTDAIRGPACSNLEIGPGTWLATDPGAGGGQTANALRDFCNANGGTSGNNNRFTCLASPKVRLAIWDQHNGLSGNNLQYRVKYVGVFGVSGFDKGGGPSNPEQITGFFSTMNDPGGSGFTTTPSLTTKAVMVY